MNNICVGIVTYNPNVDLLKSCINSIINQVGTIFVVDNSSTNIDEISLYCDTLASVNLIKFDKNRGIATALNRIGYEAERSSYDYFLTLDQDSVCPDNLISEYSQYFEDETIGMFCPEIKLRVHETTNETNDDVEIVDVAITSGCLVRTSAWKNVKFWDALFIDKVDDDFCYALARLSYKILKVKKVILEHEIGTPSLFSFCGIKFYTDSYPPFRYYYIARNTIIVYSYYKNTGYSYAKIITKKLFKIIVGEKDKMPKLIHFLKGVRDGICWRFTNQERIVGNLEL